jgi:hypothetical protein
MANSSCCSLSQQAIPPCTKAEIERGVVRPTVHGIIMICYHGQAIGFDDDTTCIIAVEKDFLS